MPNYMYMWYATVAFGKRAFLFYYIDSFLKMKTNFPSFLKRVSLGMLNLV